MSLDDGVLQFSDAKLDNVTQHPANLLDGFNDFLELIHQEVRLNDELLEVHDLALTLDVLLGLTCAQSLGTLSVVLGVLRLNLVQMCFQKLHERLGFLCQAGVLELVVRNGASNHLKLLTSKLKNGLSAHDFLLPPIKMGWALGLKFGKRFAESEDVEWCAHTCTQLPVDCKKTHC